MQFPINSYFRTIVLFPCFLTGLIINYIGNLGHRTCIWLRQCFGIDQRINDIRDQQLSTLSNLSINMPVTPRENVSSSSEIDSPKALPSPVTAPTKTIEKYTEDLDQYLIKAWMTGKYSDEFLGPAYQSCYLPVLEFIKFHRDAFLASIEEKLKLMGCESVIDEIAETIASHLIRGKEEAKGPSEAYKTLLKVLIQKTSKRSTPILFAACLLEDVELVRECFQTNEPDMHKPNRVGFIAFNYLKRDSFDQLIKDGLQVPDITKGLFFEGERIKFFYRVPSYFGKKEVVSMQIADFHPNRISHCYKHEMVSKEYCANYVLDRKGIAASGPQQHTIGNFWKMVVESGTDLIVQLETVKCYQYWPKGANEVLTFEGIQIENVSIVDAINLNGKTIIIRNLRVNNINKTHIEVRGWPDAGVIPPKVVMTLIETIHRIKPKLFLIHCLVGIGRTGVVLAAYELYYSHLKGITKQANNVLLQLRKERMRSVQTAEQYRLILRCEARIKKIKTPLP